MFFNNKGQAFDVFKLLIAAIVAVAILVVLLPLLVPPTLPGNDPVGEARTIIKDLATKHALPRTSQPVIFNPNLSINARGIAEGSSGAVSEESVCVSPGDFSDNEDTWEIDSAGIRNRVTYKGTSAKKVALHAICDTGKRIAGVGLEDLGCGNYAECYDTELQMDWFDGCPCNNTDFTETCCLLAIKKAT